LFNETRLPPEKESVAIISEAPKIANARMLERFIVNLVTEPVMRLQGR
jgi:hypothetical protein